MHPKEKRQITNVTRRDIVDELLISDERFYGRLDLISFLKRIWDLKSMPSTDGRFENAEGDIWQHMVNNDDWSYHELLYNRLSVLDMPDDSFAQFLEACVHPLASPDLERTNGVVEIFNRSLRNDGLVMLTDGQVSSRRIYKVVSLAGADGLGGAYEVVCRLLARTDIA